MMIDLAMHQGSGYVSLKDISERQDISKKYLEQIIPMLNRAGLLAASRGAGGGYRLIKKPEEYTVGEILRVTEGSMAPVACLEATGECCCPRCGKCMTKSVWAGLYKAVTDYVDGINLQDIIDNNGAEPGDFYNI